MPNALLALGAAFLAAGLLARGGKRFGLPTIPLFMVAGIVAGPFSPGPVLFSDAGDLELLATLGLVFLLFQAGLEFSIEELTHGGRKLLAAGSFYVALHLFAGFGFGMALGFSTTEAVVMGGIIATSSSAITTKLLIDLGRLANRETPMILGVLVVQDIFVALFLTALVPILGTASTSTAVTSGVTSFGFLIAVFVITKWGFRAVHKLITSADDELLTILFIGLVVLIAGLGEQVGLSAAIGALGAGLIISQTSLDERVQRLVLPLRDAFGAIFFFAFGASFDISSAIGLVGPVAILVITTLTAGFLSGAVAGRIYGFGPKASARIGLTLMSRGEFSLIIATIALGAGLDSRIGRICGAYVLVMALIGPLVASRPKPWISMIKPLLQKASSSV